MTRRSTRTALFALTLCAGCVRAPTYRAPAPDTVVQIFGQDLSAADLVPPAERAKLGEQGTTAALHLALKQRVWGAVFEDFMKKRSLEPSAGEIEECARKIQKSNADDWDPALGPIPLDLEFGGAMVRSWKLNSTLHRQYGGRVIFQQFGLEPIDAWRKLLEEYERNKAWVVPDPKLRAVVYDYFRNEFSDVGEENTKTFLARPYCGE